MRDFEICQDDALRALAFELKNPLIAIARRAELNDPLAAENIQYTAEQALMLIDGYLLNAQTEYGQIALDLTPANVGSVLYDVSTSMRTQAIRNNVLLVLDDRTHEPIMTHRPALTTILTVFASTLMGRGAESKDKKLIMRGYKTREGKIGIGMFTDAKLTREDITRALELQGKAHMPLAGVSDTAHVSLAIADGLCRAIGGSMTVKQMGRLSGLATELPRSEQLAFV